MQRPLVVTALALTAVAAVVLALAVRRHVLAEASKAAAAAAAVEAAGDQAAAESEAALAADIAAADATVRACVAVVRQTFPGSGFAASPDRLDPADPRHAHVVGTATEEATFRRCLADRRVALAPDAPPR